MSLYEGVAQLKLPLEEILEATENFADKNLIGQGGFVKVYKGNLFLSGKQTNIAARRLHYDYGRDDFEFWNEITLLARLKHDNLVSFIGFCDEKSEKVIINEHEVNGSLNEYLCRPITVTWTQRLQICVGVATALQYIHYDDGHDISVIHGNIKSSKILLDKYWKPKLCGFELSKKSPKAQRHRLVLAAEISGTIGYVDPAYEKTGTMNNKSDVYSFGIVLFEVLCGRRAFVPNEGEEHLPQLIEQDYKDDKMDPHLHTMKRLDHYLHRQNEELLAQLAKSHYDAENLNDIVDPALWEQMDPESFRIFSETAYKCLDDKRSQRPHIDKVLRNLKEALKLQTRRENSLTSKGESIASGEFEGTTSKKEHLEHLKIPLADIERAIKKYLGSGTYGRVYGAELKLPIEQKSKNKTSKEWRIVALKYITKDKYGQEGFDAEIELLTKCKHTNIVSLLGFCDEGRDLILVYEYAYNKSLDTYLGISDCSPNLNWIRRLKISIDIARGLNYLHTMVEDEEKIIHRDIKSGNILLGKNWVAKIADFGLSRFHHVSQQAETLYTLHIAGTQEYLCPEYMLTCKLKRAIDIYSFGVVLFEILSGKLASDPIYVKEHEHGIAHVARRRIEDGTIDEMVDPKIKKEVNELTSTLQKGPNQDSLRTYLNIACKCVAITQKDRPTAKDILEELKKALSYQENNKDTLQMSFEEIKVATRNFSLENAIGRGGFGKVFKGEVIRGNESTTIVAKRLDKTGHQGDQRQFSTELEILFEYKHQNIIGLEGYCNEKGEKIIVYEYATNRSLDRHLNNASLTWTKRLKICIDIAHGLTFLHGGALTKEMVLHRDIKSANILLNADWKAKISGFGLSAITAMNQEVADDLVDTNGYVDPVYKTTSSFTDKSDIYSFGVVLFEILYGQLLVPTKDYDEQVVTRILEQIHGEGNFQSIVFKDIEEQMAPKSLSTFRAIVSQCLVDDRDKRPTAKTVLQQLEKSLEFQEDYEQWGPKLPKDYEEILKVSTYSRTYSTKTKQDLYNLLCKGILLQDDKVLFSLGSNGERNEMVSATRFSYKNGSPHDNWCIIPESRFKKVAEMLDISDLMIEIKTRTQFLSPNTVYGVYLVFKFCDFRNVSRNPMYVDLKYRKGGRTLHAYFATWRNEEWMMIELHRFLKQKDDGDFEVLLESLSPYYYREHDAIFVEGIEFRAIENEGDEETRKSKDKGLEMTTKREMILKEYINYDYGEELFSLTEVNGKKHLMLSAKAAICNLSNVTLFHSKPPFETSFEEVLELMPQQEFRINCTIKSQMLSRDTEYVCYLVFELSEKCQELHGPVEIRNLLQKNKVAEIVYFRSPSPWNIHDITQVPKQRKDGWMEVNILKLNSNREVENGCVFVNLKLICYEGSMSGLTVCGLDFRPM